MSFWCGFDGWMVRCFLRGVTTAALTSAICLASACARSERTRASVTAQIHPPRVSVSADEALRRLMEGNARFVADEPKHPNLGGERRVETRAGQTPFAVILGCSDSRVPPDLVFDTGLGDLFGVRVAGNVTDDVVIGSIEYAVDHLGTRLILVLGHEKCGAVAAAVEAAETDADLPGHIQSLVEAIEPALRDTPHPERERLDGAVRANVRYVTERLRHAAPILSKAVKSGDLKVVGGYYDLKTGRVEIIDGR